MKKKFTKKALAFLLIVALALAFNPMMAFAAPGDTWPEAIIINPGETKTIGGSPTVHSQDDKRFYIDIAVPSIVALELSTVTPCPAGEEWRGNEIEMEVLHANTDSEVWDDSWNKGRKTLHSLELPIKEQYTYKLMPGKYYIKAYGTSAYNCYGQVKYVSRTNAKAQTETKHNFNVMQGLANKAIVSGQTVNGLINYHTKLPDNSNQYGTYEHNFYKYVVKHNKTTLKITASRSDTWRQNDTDVYLARTDGSPAFDGRIKLDTAVNGGSVTYKNVPKGTYLVHVDGWSAVARTTEYTLKVTEITVPATKITLNKSKLTLKKKKSFNLKVKNFSPSNVNPKSITWKSSNPKVVKVNKTTGKITALKKGKATITAKTWNGTTAKCVVTVKK